jgi:hypothetical protein
MSPPPRAQQPPDGSIGGADILSCLP